jgi:hypothetical protein
VIFQRTDFASAYIVHYRIDGVVRSLPPTIDHYADLTNLPLDKVCTVWVTGKNEAGESLPSEQKEFVPRAGYGVLPPVIWLSEPANQSFFVGYSFHYTDLSYLLRYGKAIQDTSQWHVITTEKFGMLQVPGLQNGERYYYQLARRSGFNALGNSWSEIKEVIPHSDHAYGETVVHGFAQQGDQLLVSVTPSKNARGFTITCQTNKGVRVYPANFAEVSLFRVALEPGLNVKSVAVKPIN